MTSPCGGRTAGYPGSPQHHCRHLQLSLPRTNTPPPPSLHYAQPADTSAWSLCCYHPPTHNPNPERKGAAARPPQKRNHHCTLSPLGWSRHIPHDGAHPGTLLHGCFARAHASGSPTCWTGTKRDPLATAFPHEEKRNRRISEASATKDPTALAATVDSCSHGGHWPQLVQLPRGDAAVPSVKLESLLRTLISQSRICHTHAAGALTPTCR